MLLLCRAVPGEVERREGHRSHTSDLVVLLLSGSDRPPNNRKGRRALSMPFMSVGISPGTLRKKAEPCLL